MSFSAPDYRINPFTGVFTPNPIGYSGNPVEEKVIPATANYWILLDELPRQDTPSTLLINQKAGPSFTEVSEVTPPAAGQFRVIYGGDGITTEGRVGQGTVEFNVIDAGKTMEIKYYGLGAILQNQFFNQLFNGDFGLAELFANGIKLGNMSSFLSVKKYSGTTAPSGALTTVTSAHGLGDTIAYAHGNIDIGSGTLLQVPSYSSSTKYGGVSWDDDTLAEGIYIDHPNTAPFHSRPYELWVFYKI